MNKKSKEKRKIERKIKYIYREKKGKYGFRHYSRLIFSNSTIQLTIYINIYFELLLLLLNLKYKIIE